MVIVRRVWISLFTLFSVCAFAQSDPVFSHYMLNPAYYNPGWIGNINSAFASFQHRSQWTGYTSTFDGSGGAPGSQLVTFIAPVHGVIKSVGANVLLDRQGPETTIQFEVGGAYNLAMQKGTLSFGLMPSLISRRIDNSILRPEVSPDPLISGLSESQTKPDLSAGVFYRTYSGYFAGLGVKHLLSPSLVQVESETSDNRLSQTYYLHGGAVFNLSRDLEFMPTFLLRTTLSGFSLDLGGMATIRETMWGGLSFRQSEAVILLLGYSFLENKELRVGYSFDYVIKDQTAKRPTSHEIFIRYDIPGFILGGRKAVKTPRFSF